MYLEFLINVFVDMCNINPHLILEFSSDCSKVASRYRDEYNSYFFHHNDKYSSEVEEVLLDFLNNDGIDCEVVGEKQTEHLVDNSQMYIAVIGEDQMEYIFIYALCIFEKFCKKRNHPMMPKAEDAFCLFVVMVNYARKTLIEYHVCSISFMSYLISVSDVSKEISPDVLLGFDNFLVESLGWDLFIRKEDLEAKKNEIDEKNPQRLTTKQSLTM